MDTMSTFEPEKLVVHGTSFRTSPLEVRERLAMRKGEERETILKLKKLEAEEYVVLSTCNRVEFILYGREDAERLASELRRINEERTGISLREEFFYTFQGRDALRHIFRVTSSLDSMVVGEPQITGQVKEAYERAVELGCAGKYLKRIFERAFFVAKRVRRETAIGENPHSISSQAVELAESIFGDLSTRKALVIGTGEMGELAIKSFISRGISRIYITSRSVERAEEICSLYSGEVLPFKDLYRGLEEVDIVLCSSAAPHYLITKEDIKRVMKRRRGAPLFIIDISLPRNIAPDVNEVDNVYLYHIDDLQKIVDKNMKKRKEEALKSETIVEEEVQSFLARIKEEKIGPAIGKIYEKAEEIRKRELDELMRILRNLSEDQIKAIENFSTNLMKKLLHTPVIRAKLAMRNGDFFLADALYRLFGEENEAEDRDEGK